MIGKEEGKAQMQNNMHGLMNEKIMWKIQIIKKVGNFMLITKYDKVNRA